MVRNREGAGNDGEREADGDAEEEEEREKFVRRVLCRSVPRRTERRRRRARSRSWVRVREWREG